MSDNTAPEHIWAQATACANWDEPLATKRRVDHFHEYVLKASSDARVAELEAERDAARAWVHRLCANGSQFAAFMHPNDEESQPAHRAQYRKWRSVCDDALKAITPRAAMQKETP